MTKATAIRNYRKYSAATLYVVGFEYKHTVYAATMSEIPPRFIRVEHESSKKGGGEKLQLRLINKDMEALIRKGAECIGSSDILNGQYNKGVEFERIISERNGQEYRGKDSVPFYVSGDLEIKGQQTQIKMNGAQIVTYSTLEKLKNRA